ncbi:TonB-dependent receptor [Croceibacterium ferulae]|uniref:TonB-dependent receptor n=1 Tax=Croceibacterium ferulae TaxID=1854641 RepID=UPI000EAB9DB6|nr:TonB-dependent receptor [Croceibacterium ferulae]
MSAIRTIPSYLALGCVSAFAFSTGAQAQQGEQPQRLGSATVTSTAIDDEVVKVEEAESPKYTQPLLDIPQTITVLSNTTLRQQNLLTLREALTTIPGITFGAGEGGGGYGDSINLRGQSANNDLQIDGVRDSAQYNRSDTFNLEQIEVVNGANSVYAGSGSIGGTINLITKRPRADDLTIVSGGIGTDEYYRGTIDSNVRVAENIAVRLNAMVHHNEFADRDFESAERWGVAPSVTFGIDGPTSLTLLYQHQEDENTPVYGVPYYSALGGLLPGADYGGYYGYRDVDRQDQTIDLATAIVEHQFSDVLSVRNLFRLSHIDADIVVNPPQGAYCLASGSLPTGAACEAGQIPGTYYPSGPRGTTRFTETELLHNQLDLMASFDTGGVQHNVTLGLAYTSEDYRLDNGNSLRNPGGVTPNPALPPINIADPDAIYGGPVNFVRTGRQRGTTSNVALYLFDAVELGEQFEINGGIRWERNDARFRSDTVSTAGAITPGAVQESEDNLFSYRIGAVFKPVPNASLYAAYGNSRTPTSASVRGGCGAANAEQILIGAEPCGVNPQEAVNYEIGGKVDLFDAGLQLTAALFRNERTNYPVTSNDPAIGNLQVNDGRNRVNGVALGAAGRITPEWTVFANYTYLDSQVLQSVSNYCLANPGTSYTPPTGGNAVTCPLTDLQAGNPLTNTPEHSGSLFTTYTLPFGLQVGYGFTYQGSFLLTNTATPFIRSDDWMTHRFYLAYTMDNGLAAQLNVQNVFEERYFTGIRNNGWATPGEGRSAVLTLSYSY